MKWTIDSNTGDIMSEQSRIARVYGATEYNRSTSSAKCMRTARLIASAPEMYELLRELKKIANLKAKAASEENDTLFTKALVAQDGAINMASELIARIDREEDAE